MANATDCYIVFRNNTSRKDAVYVIDAEGEDLAKRWGKWADFVKNGHTSLQESHTSPLRSWMIRDRVKNEIDKRYAHGYSVVPSISVFPNFWKPAPWDPTDPFVLGQATDQKQASPSEVAKFKAAANRATAAAASLAAVIEEPKRQPGDTRSAFLEL